MDPINEIRWVCERCMGLQGKFIPDSAVAEDWWSWCNVCNVLKTVYNVELFSARYAPEG
jgi:hypothetical protein